MDYCINWQIRPNKVYKSSKKRIGGGLRTSDNMWIYIFLLFLLQLKNYIMRNRILNFVLFLDACGNLCSQLKKSSDM